MRKAPFPISGRQGRPNETQATGKIFNARVELSRMAGPPARDLLEATLTQVADRESRRFFLREMTTKTLSCCGPNGLR
jgi:hypothetical protein